MEDAERYRCRRIYLKPSDDPALQADAACAALTNIDGILLASPFDPRCIHVIYSLDALSYDIIVDLLNELEFETDSSLLISLRHTLFCYLEDNARDNMHIDVTEFETGASSEPDPDRPTDDDKYWDDYR